MRRSRAIGATAGAVVIALAGYTALDVYDVVPGFLTLAGAKPAAVPEPGQTAPPAKHVDPPGIPAIPTVKTVTDAPAVVPAMLAAALKGPLASNLLPSTVGVAIRDGQTGQHLFDQNPTKPMEPASITKLVSAWAISQVMNLDKPLTTSVVDDGGNTISLVAGGDVLLNPGKGVPGQVIGHAGLDDLAAQVAQKLTASGRHTVTVDTDLSYAPGSTTAPGWTDLFLNGGYTNRIAMLGLSTKKSNDHTPASPDPVGDTTRAFVKALDAHGVSAKLGTTSTTKATGTMIGSVQSSPLVDVLGIALQDSDNAMIDGLLRQAAFSQGVKGDFPSITAWVLKLLRDKGFDTAGVKLADGSGLSPGTRVPPRLFADLLTSATSGKDPTFEDAISRLAVGGWNGTTHDRFQHKDAANAAGWVRAKTGSLSEVNSLAGTVIDNDGRLLTFAVITNGRQLAGPDNVRAAIDAVVATAARCGCR